MSTPRTIGRPDAGNAGAGRRAPGRPATGKATGKVYLVGAGPGAADLLTLRAARLLAEADIVLHDALIGDDVLALARRAQKVAVGKRCGTHSTSQRFINKRLCDAARSHRVVVRLKGGDPMLFGRAHEEIEALAEAGIECEVVPGVTAALAAAADARMSLTRRGVSRSVAFVTPRIGEGERAGGWARAAAAADTAVIYMGAGDAIAVSAALCGEGLAPSTPVAMIESASLPGRRILASTLAALPSLVALRGNGPALIIVGDVCQGLDAVDANASAPLRRASA